MSAPEIQQPTPGARKRAAVIMAIGAVTGLVALWVSLRALPAIEAWVTAPADVLEQARRLKVVLAVLMAAMALPLVALAVHLWRVGTQVVRGGRFPPANATVVRPTPVLVGDAARRRGRLIQGCSLALVLAVVGLAVLWWRLSTLLSPEHGS